MSAPKTTAQLLKEKRSTFTPQQLEALRKTMPQDFAEMEAELHVNKWLSKYISSYPVIEELKGYVRKLADTDDPVLITGETGTGKEIIANALHGERGEAKLEGGGKFLAINCAGLPDTLAESILFGHKGGAFTGATKEDKVGILQAAHHGTVFLDEIGDLSLPTQAKILRALQEKVISRVGAENEAPIPITCRIVAATHKPVDKLVAAGEFREDLYYRINTFNLTTVPLRERSADIPLIVKHLIIRDKASCNYEIEDIEEFCAPLMKHREKLKGNVRQLEQIVRRYHVLGIMPKFE
jgi:transcriptional regulator with PAS, ATPase and Fis domain